MEYFTYQDDGREKCNFQNKICYPTKTQARKARKYYEIKYHTYYRVYQCEYCRKWHLTKESNKFNKNKVYY